MMSRFICIQTFANRFQAMMAKSVLEENGIKASISADDAGGMRPDLGFTSGGIKLFVLENNAEESITLLNKHLEITPQLVDNHNEKVVVRLMEHRRRRRMSQHHRPWWNLNVIILCLALFLLVYIRFFANISQWETVFGILLVVLGWIVLRQVGIKLQELFIRFEITRLPKKPTAPKYSKPKSLNVNKA